MDQNVGIGVQGYVRVDVREEAAMSGAELMARELPRVDGVAADERSREVEVVFAHELIVAGLCAGGNRGQAICGWRFWLSTPAQ